MGEPDDAPLFCARCATPLRPGRGELYRVTIEAVADPAPPMFHREDLETDAGAEIRELIARMGDLTEREAMDQVHRRLVLHLCVPCYARWIEDPAGA